jgi:hypothetical protein
MGQVKYITGKFTCPKCGKSYQLAETTAGFKHLLPQNDPDLATSDEQILAIEVADPICGCEVEQGKAYVLKPEFLGFALEPNATHPHRRWVRLDTPKGRG